jgi:hypothetical protein
MTAGGGFVRDRLDCRFMRYHRYYIFSSETHPFSGKHQLGTSGFDKILRLRTSCRCCSSGEPTVWSPTSTRLTISHLLARIGRDSMIQRHQREKDGIQGGGRQNLHNVRDVLMVSHRVQIRYAGRSNQYYVIYDNSEYSRSDYYFLCELQGPTSREIPDHDRLPILTRLTPPNP